MSSLQSTDVQLSLTDWLANQNAKARGETFDSALDKARLDNQSLCLIRVMRDGEWHTFASLQAAGVPGQQPSISARIREVRAWLRETARGTIERRRHPDTTKQGLWQYRMEIK